MAERTLVEGVIFIFSWAWETNGDAFLLHSGAQIAAFTPLLVATKILFPKHKDPWALADTLMSVVLYPLLVYFAVLGSSSLYSDVQTRWRGVTPESSSFLMLYVTRSTLHMGMQAMQEMKWSLFVLMSLHHFLSIVCCGSGVVTGNMHFFGCFAGVCEISTVFLNNVWLFKEVKIRDVPLQSYLPGWIYALNGLFLWLGFVVFRLLLFPCWLWMFYADVSAAPQSTWDASSPVERYMMPLVIVFLLVISTYWMVPITKGFFKAAGLWDSDWDDRVKGE